MTLLLIFLSFYLFFSLSHSPLLIFFLFPTDHFEEGNKTAKQPEETQTSLENIFLAAELLKCHQSHPSLCHSTTKIAAGSTITGSGSTSGSSSTSGQATTSTSNIVTSNSSNNSISNVTNSGAMVRKLAGSNVPSGSSPAQVGVSSLVKITQIRMLKTFVWDVVVVFVVLDFVVSGSLTSHYRKPVLQVNKQLSKSIVC